MTRCRRLDCPLDAAPGQAYCTREHSPYGMLEFSEKTKKKTGPKQKPTVHNYYERWKASHPDGAPRRGRPKVIQTPAPTPLNPEPKEMPMHLAMAIQHINESLQVQESREKIEKLREAKYRLSAQMRVIRANVQSKKMRLQEKQEKQEAQAHEQRLV